MPWIGNHVYYLMCHMLTCPSPNFSISLLKTWMIYMDGISYPWPYSNAGLVNRCLWKGSLVASDIPCMKINSPVMESIDFVGCQKTKPSYHDLCVLFFFSFLLEGWGVGGGWVEGCGWVGGGGGGGGVLGSWELVDTPISVMDTSLALG